nr:CBS domain-containing protein [Nanchangia anserum]
MGITLVREVIVPRTDMVTLDKDTTGRRALELLSQSGFSRIPVTGEDTDDVRGVVYLKDLVHRLINRPDVLDRPVHELMREAHFVPETMRVDDLLRQMRSGETHLAIVFDEWGGTVGLVTIEDLIEELVGEVTDEHDKPEVTIEQLGPDCWSLPARMSIDDLGELFDIEIAEDDVDTVGGLLQKALGSVPLEGDEAETWGLILRAGPQEGRRRQVSAIVASRAGESEGDARE